MRDTELKLQWRSLLLRNLKTGSNFEIKPISGIRLQNYLETIPKGYIFIFQKKFLKKFWLKKIFFG